MVSSRLIKSIHLYQPAVPGGVFQRMPSALKSHRETNNNNKKNPTPYFFFPRLKLFHLYLSITAPVLIVLGGKTSHGLGSSPRLSIWWDCKPQGQSSAPVSSDPWAGMFSRYNLGFSSHSFPNPTLTERSLLLFPSIVAFFACLGSAVRD